MRGGRGQWWGVAAEFKEGSFVAFLVHRKDKGCGEDKKYMYIYTHICVCVRVCLYACVCVCVYLKLSVDDDLASSQVGKLETDLCFGFCTAGYFGVMDESSAFIGERW